MGNQVAFASRSLTSAEQNYAQIEKECLAIVFSCERFDQYLHGRELVKVNTDHKPLVPIFTKPIHKAPKRLQRMLLRLQKYNLSVQYLPGSQMYIADMLSRASLKSTDKSCLSDYQMFQLRQEEQLQSEIEVINQSSYLCMKDSTQLQIKKATQSDSGLQMLKNVVLDGWPEQRNEVPICIREYFGSRQEITVQDGVLHKGMRVIVPKSMHSMMLTRIHSSHLGVEVCLRRAREVLYWPGMASQIKDRVSQSQPCNEFMNKQQKEPMMSYEIPNRAWSVVSQDLFHYRHADYLITVDHYSDYWELDKLDDTRSETIVECTKKHFSRFGIPSKVITDNGPQFIAVDYEEFSREWEFEHVTSSPYHSQSNGKAESAVKIAKNIIKKVTKAEEDLHLAILDWRNTPDSSGSSPVQKLMSKRAKNTVANT